MYKKFRNLEIIGFFVVSALAVGFHFIYDATQSPILAAIAPANESIWEHIKMIFFPYFIWAIVEMLILKPSDKSAFGKQKAMDFYRCHLCSSCFSIRIREYSAIALQR